VTSHLETWHSQGVRSEKCQEMYRKSGKVMEVSEGWYFRENSAVSVLGWLQRRAVWWRTVFCAA